MTCKFDERTALQVELFGRIFHGFPDRVHWIIAAPERSIGGLVVVDDCLDSNRSVSILTGRLELRGFTVS